LDSLELLLVDEVSQEFVVVSLGLVLLEVGLWHNFEKESKDTVAELGSLGIASWEVSSGMFLLELVHDMHLEVEKFSIEGVLRWGVEMELHSVEVGTLDMWVEEGDGAGVHEVVLDKLVVSVLHVLEWEDKGLRSLGEFIGELWFHNLVVALEHIILEFFSNLLGSVEVNWRLLHTSDFVDWVSGGLVDAHGPLDSWSLLDWVLVGLIVIVQEILFSVNHFGSVWKAIDSLDVSLRISQGKLGGSLNVLFHRVGLDGVQGFGLDSLLGEWYDGSDDVLEDA